MKDELSNQNSTKQKFLVKSIFRPDGKLVDTVMPLKDNNALDKYSSSIDELCDEGSIMMKDSSILTIQEGKTVSETNKKTIGIVENIDCGKWTNDIDEKIADHLSKFYFIPLGTVKCFHRCLLFSCSRARNDYSETPSKEIILKSLQK